MLCSGIIASLFVYSDQMLCSSIFNQQDNDDAGCDEDFDDDDDDWFGEQSIGVLIF